MAGQAWNGAAFTHNNTMAPKEEKVFNLFSCKGKTAIVTGGASGIGFAVVHALAEAGANVAIWYNSNSSASDRAREIEEEYGVTCESRSHVSQQAYSQVILIICRSTPYFHCTFEEV